MSKPTADEVLAQLNRPGQSLSELKSSRDAVLEYRGRLQIGHPYVQKIDSALLIANARIAELSQDSKSKGKFSILKSITEHPIIAGSVLLLFGAILSYFGIKH